MAGASAILGMSAGFHDETMMRRLSGSALQEIDRLTYLVDGLAVGCRRGSPLLAINGAKVTRLVRPVVPDAYAVVLQILDVGIAGENQINSSNDRLQVQLLVVTRGKPSARSNRIWWPNTLKVPVPVRSVFMAPVSRTRRMRSRYCCMAY